MIQEANLRGQLQVTRQIVDVETRLLNILRRQFTAGQAAEADVRQQEAALAQAEQTVPPLEKQLAQQRNQLSALLGRLPADEPGEEFRLPD
ncbi:MAG TPA: TolC family protein, partial [Rhodopila sp.]|nr:TolC family protein [Rhodopila sp.]